MIELDHIYNEDCLQGRKQIPDGTIDAVITSPPYDIYGDMMKAVTETREKMLNAASEHYGIPKEEIERQVEQIDAEVRKEHPEAFII